jgi:hypothetical protein
MTKLKWAIGDNIHHGRNKQLKNLSNHLIKWVDICSLHESSFVCERLEIGEYNGKSVKVGLLAEKAKEHWRSGKFMDPVSIIYDNEKDACVFADGRHRLVAAYQLGARKIPVLMRQSDSTNIDNLLSQQTVKERFKNHKTPDLYTISYWEFCLSHETEITIQAKKAAKALLCNHPSNCPELVLREIKKGDWNFFVPGSAYYMYYFGQYKQKGYKTVWAAFTRKIDEYLIEEIKNGSPVGLPYP